MPTYQLYGVSLRSHFDFTWPLPLGEASADLEFACADQAPIAVDFDAAKPLFAEARHDDPERLAYSFYHEQGIDVVRFWQVADHYLFPDRIVCHLHEPSLRWLVEIQLLGMVMALWLERHGIATLHASCAVVEGRAVAFLGMRGGGKTTAVAALVAAGHAMLVDDLAVVDLQGGEVMVNAGYPMLRLWPEQVAQFAPDSPELPLVHPHFEKRKLVLSEAGLRFHQGRAPLARIYLPSRSMSEGPTIARLSSANGLIALVRHSFLQEAMHPLGLAGMRLRTLARIVDRVPVAALTYPNGFDRLDALVSAVTADLAGD